MNPQMDTSPSPYQLQPRPGDPAAPPPHQSGDAGGPDGPIHPGSGRRRFDWRRILAPFGAAALLLAKVGAKLKVLLLLLPKIKLLTTSGTMLVSVAAYSLI